MPCLPLPTMLILVYVGLLGLQVRLAHVPVDLDTVMTDHRTYPMYYYGHVASPSYACDR